jgi:hypothetical protein
MHLRRIRLGLQTCKLANTKKKTHNPHATSPRYKKIRKKNKKIKIYMKKRQEGSHIPSFHGHV